MRLLLDTHVFLWLTQTPERLKTDVLQTIRNPDNAVFLSAASAWELSIKYSLGKILLPMEPGAFAESRCKRLRITPLDISFVHAAGVAQLPMLHRDPFDRLLIAQGIAESLTLVTVDPQITKYSVQSIFAS